MFLSINKLPNVLPQGGLLVIDNFLADAVDTVDNTMLLDSIDGLNRGL
jgi:hypothetical protein